jgi:hypothetical protein
MASWVVGRQQRGNLRWGSRQGTGLLSHHLLQHCPAPLHRSRFLLLLLLLPLLLLLLLPLLLPLLMLKSHELVS